MVKDRMALFVFADGRTAVRELPHAHPVYLMPVPTPFNMCYDPRQLDRLPVHYVREFRRTTDSRGVMIYEEVA